MAPKFMEPLPLHGASGWDGSLLKPRELFRSPSRPDWENASRRLTFNARLSGDDILCRVLGKYIFVVDASDVGFAPHLIADGFWEIWITRLIARRVTPGMVCLDAGANIGYYSVLMADLAGAQGKVVAVEPMAANRRLLTRNVGHNGFASRTRIIEAALGASAGEAEFVVPRGEPKNAQIGCVEDALVESGEIGRFRAPVMPIDALELPRLDFVKIDVEGSEEAVWAGMQETIGRSPHIQIVMEINCSRYRDPEAFLRGIEASFPLRVVDGLGEPVPMEFETMLRSPTDVMLYLAR